MNDYAIETEALTRRFGKITAVDRLSLQVTQGSVFAFLGPNGAGKTTTIKMLMNLIHANSGSARILGQDSKKLGPRQFQRIGYVSENQETPRWMTVKAFLDFCKPLYPTWDDSFCEKLLADFELPLNRKIKHLSRGMKAKTALLSSLAYRPELLVLDEPFTGLDPLVRDDFITAVKELIPSGEWTIFISSHDLPEVEMLADQVGIIDKGKLRLVEEIAALRSRFRQQGGEGGGGQKEMSLREIFIALAREYKFRLPHLQGSGEEAAP